MNNLRSLMSATLLALALAAPSVRAADETPSPWKFEFHGWVTASMYYQDQAFNNGQGQGLTYSAPSPTNSTPCVVAGSFGCAAGTAIKKGTDVSGDVRNSRFSFSMAGPKVFGDAQPRAYLEFDFFGLNGAGTFGSEQPIPRLRVGYAELKLGATNIQVGQQNQLVVSQIPGSISHITNPMTYGAGTIGWRTPGVRVSQTIPIDDVKLELAVEAVKNKWSNEAVNAMGGPGGGPYVTGPITCTQAAPVPPATIGVITCTTTTAGANTPGTIGYGESSGMPMFQARAKVDGKAGDLTYMAYLVGVYHTIDLNGFGDGATIPAYAAGKKSITGYVGEVGGKITYTPWVSVAANVYTGKTTGNMLGSMLAFGDVKDMGYWVNVTGNFTKELSLGLLYGADAPNKADMRRVGGNAVRLANNVVGGMLKYQDGGYAVGVEGYQNSTTWSTGAATEEKTKALQVIATAAYFF